MENSLEKKIYPFAFEQNHEQITDETIQSYFKKTRPLNCRRNHELYDENQNIQNIFKKREEEYNSTIDILMEYLPYELCDMILGFSGHKISKKNNTKLQILKRKCFLHFEDLLEFSQKNSIYKLNIFIANVMLNKSSILFVNLNEFYREILDLETKNIYYENKYTCSVCSLNHYDPYDAVYCCST